MKDFFYAIQDLFVNVLFAPYDALRTIQLDSWWAANVVSWILIITGFITFLYWFKQIESLNDNTE